MLQKALNMGNWSSDSYSRGIAIILYCEKVYAFPETTFRSEAYEFTRMMFFYSIILGLVLVGNMIVHYHWILYCMRQTSGWSISLSSSAKVMPTNYYRWFLLVGMLIYSITLTLGYWQVVFIGALCSLAARGLFTSCRYSQQQEWWRLQSHAVSYFDAISALLADNAGGIAWKWAKLPEEVRGRKQISFDAVGNYTARLLGKGFAIGFQQHDTFTRHYFCRLWVFAGIDFD